MFYGRIDVYWPDGPIESYRLDKPTVAIGRSSGNDIVLDTTAVSRYHITIIFKNQQTLLEDLESVNGTYVDGIRLPAHEAYVLRGGEDIQIGDVRLIYHPPTDLTAFTTDTTQHIALAQPTYQIELEGPDMAVSPGAHVLATLKIENIGDEIDRYLVEVEGLPKGWARVDRGEVEIDPGEQAQVTITLKPLRRSESSPGDHPFIVRVRPKSKPTQTIDIPTVLSVLPYSGFGMALSASRIENGEGFKVYVHNQGNAPLPLSVQGTDPSRTLKFRLSETKMVLAAGERHTLAGTVQLHRPKVFGQPHEYEFAITARSQDAAAFVASVPGTYVEKGLLPHWLLALVLPLMVLSVLGVIGLFWLFWGGKSEKNETLPSITFTVSNPSITLGEKLQLAWEVKDADAVELVVEDTATPQQYTVESAASAYSLTLDQTGIFTLVLKAHHGKSIKTVPIAVEVRPAVALRLEVLDASDLMRYVQHDVRLSWTVNGARAVDGGYRIWFESPDTAVSLPAAPLALTGSQNIQVVLKADVSEWLVTLYAEGEDGVTASVTQKLAVSYPSCELRAPRTLVRSGPGETYQAIVPPLEGTQALMPVARNPAGDWLQVSIGVGDNARLGWVLRADFHCIGFDPSRLVPTTDFPPPPEISTRTATPVAPTPVPVTPTRTLPPTAVHATPHY